MEVGPEDRRAGRGQGVSTHRAQGEGTGAAWGRVPGVGGVSRDGPRGALRPGENQVELGPVSKCTGSHWGFSGGEERG